MNDNQDRKDAKERQCPVTHEELRLLLLRLSDVDIDDDAQVSASRLDSEFARTRRLDREAARKRRSVIGMGALGAVATALIGAFVSYVAPGSIEWITQHMPGGVSRPVGK
jgi:hypothetical protein